jgi:ferredoxin-NADP reductase
MSTVTIEHIREIGPSTLAITLEAPDQFEAYPGQFVLLRAEIDGEEVSSYYTLSSPEVDDRFEITIAVDEESGTLGPWLAERTTGDTVDIDGPFGDVYYKGEDDVTVLAGGPGIGPAVAIGERAATAGRNATILYQADEPVHEDRLSSLRDANMTVELLADGAELPEALDSVEIRGSVYVFGFAEFVTDTRDALEAIGINSDNIHVESFGPA